MVWTETTRRKYRRDGLRYASGTTDPEWAVLEPLRPPVRWLGRPRLWERRPIVNAILYVLATGCQWRALPRDFPPRSTVQGYFYRWRNDGTWDWINARLAGRARQSLSRNLAPSAGIIDSQSASTTESGARRASKASSSCPGDGSSSAPLHGWAEADASPRTSRRPSKAPPLGCSSRASAYSSGVSQDLDPNTFI